MKLATADLSKPLWNNNSVIAPHSPPPPNPLGGGRGVLSARCLSVSPVGMGGAGNLSQSLAPSYRFTERKFLKGRARQIATEPPTLPPSPLLFPFLGNLNWERLMRLSPAFWALRHFLLLPVLLLLITSEPVCLDEAGRAARGLRWLLCLKPPPLPCRE